MTIIFSINVHEKVDFLKKQLDNIREFVLSNYIVVLNCNQYMYEECSKTGFPPNIWINPEIIEKKRFHGSITQGIYSNMKYAFNIHADFRYFVVLSSRNMFYKPMQEGDLAGRQMRVQNPHAYQTLCKTRKTVTKDWHWKSFKKTMLACFFTKHDFSLYSSQHEGLVFHKTVCLNMIWFLDSKPMIRDHLFQYNNCVEEFALQTIAVNCIHPQKRQVGFISIGRGWDLEYPPIEPAKNSFVYRAER